MAKMAMVVLCVVVACMVVAAPYVDAAITCGQVGSALAPCIAYLTKGGPVPPACCAGVTALNSAAKTTPDRQAACRCLKSYSKSVNPNNAESLPGKCGVNIPYKISPSIDCNMVH